MIAEFSIPHIYFEKKAVVVQDGKVMFNPEADFIMLRGGRGRAGSWTMISVAVMMAMSEKMTVLILRQSKTGIRDSVWELVKDTAIRLECEDLFTFTDKHILLPNGSKFIYDHMHNNHQGIKSKEGIRLTLGEECQEWEKRPISSLKFTIMRDDNSQFVGCMNPENEDDPVETEIVSDVDCLTVNATMYDNYFAPKKLLRQADKLKEYDPEEYAHQVLGGYNKSADEIVFGGKCVQEYINTKEYTGERYYGMDWGFGGHPSTFVETGQDGDDILILDSIYWLSDSKKSWDADAIADALIERHKQQPITNEIWPDPADPQSSKILKNKLEPHGILVRTKWGKDTIIGGVRWLRAHKRIVFNTHIVEFWQEVDKYRKKVDKRTGVVTNEIIDADNHGWDAARYSRHRAIKKGIL